MTHDPTSNAFQELYRIITTLRDPGGCPWDREQTLESLRPFLLEETYETLTAVANEDIEEIAEELGDVLQVALMMAYLLEEMKGPSVQTIIENARKKLVRRHPHVFEEKAEKTPREVKAQWDHIKRSVEKKESIEASPSYPPLERAYRLQKQASKQGFEWRNRGEILDKLREELGEFKAATTKKEQEEEIGDLLFVVVNLARSAKVDASVCLHGTNEKFLRRFRHLETRMKEEKLEMSQENLDIMYRFWKEV